MDIISCMHASQSNYIPRHINQDLSTISEGVVTGMSDHQIESSTQLSKEVVRPSNGIIIYSTIEAIRPSNEIIHSTIETIRPSKEIIHSTIEVGVPVLALNQDRYVRYPTPSFNHTSNTLNRYVRTWILKQNSETAR